MDKITGTNFTIDSGKLKSAIKMQEGFLPFTEGPSDKYNFIADVISETTRMSAFDLFSLFTADIIKKKVIFVR